MTENFTAKARRNRLAAISALESRGWSRCPVARRAIPMAKTVFGNRRYRAQPPAQATSA